MWGTGAVSKESISKIISKSSSESAVDENYSKQVLSNFFKRENTKAEEKSFKFVRKMVQKHNVESTKKNTILPPLVMPIECYEITNGEDVERRILGCWYCLSYVKVRPLSGPYFPQFLNSHLPTSSELQLP